MQIMMLARRDSTRSGIEQELSTLILQAVKDPEVLNFVSKT